jgi:hypothetical protein
MALGSDAPDNSILLVPTLKSTTASGAPTAGAAASLATCLSADERQKQQLIYLQQRLKQQLHQAHWQQYIRAVGRGTHFLHDDEYFDDGGNDCTDDEDDIYEDYRDDSDDVYDDVAVDW